MAAPRGATVCSDQSRLLQAKPIGFGALISAFRRFEAHSSVGSPKGGTRITLRGRDFRLLPRSLNQMSWSLEPSWSASRWRLPCGKAWLFSNLGVKSIFHGSGKIEGSSLAPKMHKNELGVFPHGMVPNRSDADPLQAKRL
jgi:hypothetical protein